MEKQCEYVSARQLAERLDIGISTVWAKVSKGLLPKPDLKIGARFTRWNWQNIVEHLERQAKGGENASV